MSNALARSESGREGFQFRALGLYAGVEFGLVGGPVKPLAKEEVFVGDLHLFKHILRAWQFAGVGGEERREIAQPPLGAHGGGVPIIDPAGLAEVGVFCGGDHAVGEVTMSWSAAL